MNIGNQRNSSTTESNISNREAYNIEHMEEVGVKSKRISMRDSKSLQRNDHHASMPGHVDSSSIDLKTSIPSQPLWAELLSKKYNENTIVPVSIGDTLKSCDDVFPKAKEATAQDEKIIINMPVSGYLNDAAEEEEVKGESMRDS